ncbi:hypothetical protein FOS14_19715 [Skermania sp. ID1734]|uniref:hypothetical protein n=1 Tax=Skermania sp. ID1734 TaxID=2597516 RepID=UPI001180D5A7|nr:hypothetical protein [Skermania sp. ID1734]TSD94871.1 hypothetical protein FOS14_19715 [Skermania sp. ID1734]
MLAFAVVELHSALVAASSGGERHPAAGDCDADTVARVRGAVAEVTNAAAGFPRRDREVVDRWKHAAIMRYWHRRDVFAVAEEFGRRLLIDLDRRPTGEDLSDMRDEVEHAASVDLAALEATGDEPTPLTGTRRSTVGQTELVKRIRGDRRRIAAAALLGGSATQRVAHRRLVPWLVAAEAALADAPISREGLADIADQWRVWRAPFASELNDWADVTIVA